MYKICLHNRNQTLQINFIQCYASVFLKNRLTAIAGIKTISMIQSLRIIKELFEDEIELQPTMVNHKRGDIRIFQFFYQLLTIYKSKAITLQKQ